MKAVAVIPHKSGSVHLAALAKPNVEDIPNGRGVLVKVLRVGVDGTDKEINAAEYGEAPPGESFLVLGHESFGRVEAVGPGVTELRPGDHVVATVRRPGTSLYDRIGLSDMTTDDVYYERGINLRHGFLTEHYVDDADFIVKVPRMLKEVGVLLEPMTVVEKGLHQAYEILRRMRVWRQASARPGADLFGEGLGGNELEFGSELAVFPLIGRGRHNSGKTGFEIAPFLSSREAPLPPGARSRGRQVGRHGMARGPG